MTVSELTEADVLSIATEHVAAHTLFRAPIVNVRPINGGWSIGARTGSAFRVLLPGNPISSFDLNVIGETCYLLDIEVGLDFRGNGHGAALYDTCERIARDLGCTRIEQTPSGWANGGEPREDYLRRHGWTVEGTVAFREIGREGGE